MYRVRANFIPQMHFGQGTVRGVPLSIQAAVSFPLFNQHCHNSDRDSGLAPPLKPVMHGALGTKGSGSLFCWQPTRLQKRMPLKIFR
jgi:hypothetical protein